MESGTLPTKHNPIKGKWVHVHKLDENLKLLRKRARLVAKGYTQEYRIDYTETFAPVARYNTFRIILALVTQEKLDLLQLDVKAAFLNGELDETVHLEQPKGVLNHNKRSWVYLLLKALYSLKQTSRASHRVIKRILFDLWFEQLQSDCSSFIRTSGDTKIFVIVYVDDLLLSGRVKGELVNLTQKISQRVEIRVEKNISKFLDIVLHRNRKDNSIAIHSKYMISTLLTKYGMDNCVSLYIPMNPASILDQHETINRNKAEYRLVPAPHKELVGLLLHLSNKTQPDITFATGISSRYMIRRRLIHWKAARSILRYLKRTITCGIIYRCSSSSRKRISALGYCDADYAADRIERKSVSGFVFIIAEGAVSWRSKKQDNIAQSTVEAEYISRSSAMKELLCVARLLRETTNPRSFACPVTLCADNQGAIARSRNEVYHDRTKHIDVKYHFIRQHTRDVNAQVMHVGTNEMIADLMTKPPKPQKHSYFAKGLGMFDIRSAHDEGECYEESRHVATSPHPDRENTQQCVQQCMLTSGHVYTPAGIYQCKRTLSAFQYQCKHRLCIYDYQ